MSPNGECDSTYLALGEHWLDVWPGLTLGGITEQVHDDGTLVDGLVDVEEVLASNPAVLLRIFPAGTALSHADDDIQAVVAEVEALSVTLGAVADERKSVVLEIFLVMDLAIDSSKQLQNPKPSETYQKLLTRPVGTLKNDLFVAGEVDSLLAANLLHKRSLLRSGQSWSAGIDGSDSERALLDWCAQLSHRCAQRTGGILAGHCDSCGECGGVGRWEW